VTEFGFRLPIVLEFQAINDRALHASAGAKLTIRIGPTAPQPRSRPGLLTVGAIGFSGFVAIETPKALMREVPRPINPKN
jgi:hypothetical protein